MKKIVFIPGVTFQVPNIIKKIKNLTSYYVYTSSLKSKFQINENGKYIFVPLLFKIISKVFKFRNSFFQKYFDVKIFQYIVAKKKFPNNSVIFAGSCYAKKIFEKERNNLKILDVANVHVDYGIELLHREYQKFGMNFKYDGNMRRLQLKEYELADKIMVPSDYSIKSFKIFGYEKKVFKSFFSSSKESKFLKKKKIKTKNQINLGFIGGNIIIKGLYYLMKSMNNTNNKNLNLFLSLPKNYIKNFRIIEKEYDPKKMFFLGFTNNIDNFYDKIDILIVPSVSDGFAQVVIEALARNIPVICSDSVGASEYIKENFGQIFPRCSINDLIKILDNINLPNLNKQIDFIDKNYLNLNKKINESEKNFIKFIQ